jgi:hypothetical protein
MLYNEDKNIDWVCVCGKQHKSNEITCGCKNVSKYDVKTRKHYLKHEA